MITPTLVIWLFLPLDSEENMWLRGRFPTAPAVEPGSYWVFLGSQPTRFLGGKLFMMGRQALQGAAVILLPGVKVFDSTDTRRERTSPSGSLLLREEG